MPRRHPPAPAGADRPRTPKETTTSDVIRLRRERSDLVARMRNLVDQAKRQGRDLTASEQRSFDRDRDEFESLTSRIERAEELERLDLATTREIPHPDDPEGRGAISTSRPRTVTARDGSTVRILGPSDQVADLYPTERDGFGALGTLAKSLAGSVRETEVNRFLGAAGRDMLSSGGGGVLVPVPIASQVIDLLRARTVVSALGARTIPMESATLTIPRVTADPTATWGAEGAAYNVDDGDLDSVTLNPKRLGVIVKLSDELDEDSDPDLAGEVLANSLAQAFAVELDRVALRGAGTDNEPRGVRNMTGTTVMPAVGAAAWTTLTGMRRELELANSELTGFVLSPRTEDALTTQTGTDGHFINPPTTIAGIPRRTTTSVPIDLGAGDDETEIYAGRWSDLMIGLRVSFELRRLSERYADEGKVALRARLRADVQSAHGASFIVGAGVTN